MSNNIRSIDFLDTELADAGSDSFYKSSVSAQTYEMTRLNEYRSIDYEAMFEVPLALEAYVSLHHNIDL